MAGPGLGNFPWGYLGQDTSGQDYGQFSIPGQVGVDGAGNPIDADGNILNPDGSVYVGGASTSTVTVGQMATVANGGSTGNPSTDAQIAALINAAGGAAQSILKQVQLGQIASSTPIGNTALQAAIVGGGFNTSGLQSALSSLTSNPTLLLGGLLVLGFLMLRKR